MKDKICKKIKNINSSNKNEINQFYKIYNFSYTQIEKEFESETN